MKKHYDCTTDENIYELGIFICDEIYKINKKPIKDYAYAFHIISDIANGLLTDTLDKEKYFYLLGHIDGLNYYQVEEAVDRAAERLCCLAA